MIARPVLSTSARLAARRDLEVGLIASLPSTAGGVVLKFQYYTGDRTGWLVDRAAQAIFGRGLVSMSLFACPCMVARRMLAASRLIHSLHGRNAFQGGFLRYAEKRI